MFLLEVHDGLFDPNFRLEARSHIGWRLITPCVDDLASTNAGGQLPVHTLEDVAGLCPLLSEAGEFTDGNYITFVNLIGKMLKVAAGGHDWKKTMGDDVHEAGDAMVERLSGKHERHSIVQFGKKKTLVRVHTIITAGGRKLAFVSHAFVKPGNTRKTPPSEQRRCEQHLKNFLDAVDNGTAQLITAQGGRDGFINLLR